MINLKTFVIFSVLLTAVLSLSCGPQACEKVTCPELNCSENEAKRPVLCSCCEVCKKKIGVGEACEEPYILESRTVICDDGLYCDYEHGGVCRIWTGKLE